MVFVTFKGSQEKKHDQLNVLHSKALHLALTCYINMLLEGGGSLLHINHTYWVKYIKTENHVIYETLNMDFPFTICTLFIIYEYMYF